MVLSLSSDLLRYFFHATHESIAVLIGPALEGIEILIVQLECGAATWAGNHMNAISASFAPTQNGSVCLALPFAKMRKNLRGAIAHFGDSCFIYSYKICHCGEPLLSKASEQSLRHCVS